MSGQQGTFGEGVAPRWGYQTSFWQRRQPAFWLFVVSVALTGFVMLGQQLEMIGVAPDAWLLTLVLLVPYAVPVVLVVYWLDLYEREPVSILAAALVWGGVVATTLSIYTNTPLAELIFKLTGDAVFTSEWSAALTAPFVEEGFKALGIILLVSIARAELDDVLDGFVWGAMVGIGFLLVENVFYFINAFVATGGSFEGIVQIFLIRIIGAGPYSHFLYTGLIGMGVAYYHTRTGLAWGRRVAIGVALAAAGVAAHFFWNSPLLAELLGDGSPIEWFAYTTAKGLPMLIGLVLVVRLARARERRWFERFTAIGIDDETITPDEMHELASVRRRWSARRAAGGRYGAPGRRLKGLLQRQQINLAMVASRVGGAPDHPDLVKQRDLVRALKAEYEALGGGAGATAPAPAAQPVAPGVQPVAPGVQPVAPAGPARGAQPGAVAAQPVVTQSAISPPPPPPPAAWRPTHRVPDEGMAAWAAPDPTRAPMVSLGGRLDLVVVEVAGDWARVVAVNGWSGWVDGRRLVRRG
jgi:RsiW-degrading membrane proteinase PrsW (M82 family)